MTPEELKEFCDAVEAHLDAWPHLSTGNRIELEPELLLAYDQENLALRSKVDAVRVLAEQLTVWNGGILVTGMGRATKWSNMSTGEDVTPQAAGQAAGNEVVALESWLQKNWDGVACTLPTHIAVAYLKRLAKKCDSRAVGEDWENWIAENRDFDTDDGSLNRGRYVVDVDDLRARLASLREPKFLFNAETQSIVSLPARTGPTVSVDALKELMAECSVDLDPAKLLHPEYLAGLNKAYTYVVTQIDRLIQEAEKAS